MKINITKCTLFMCVLFFSVASSNLIAQETWQQIATEHSPSARSQFAMAFDEFRAVMVMHGGIDSSGNVLSDTWEFDGLDWTEVTGASGPSLRGHQMAYDIVNRKMIMVGGATSATDNSTVVNTSYYFNTTSNTWISLDNIPEALLTPVLIYDQRAEKTYLTGGRSSSGAPHAGKYRYDFSNNSWIMVDTTSTSGDINGYYNPGYTVAGEGTGFQIIPGGSPSVASGSNGSTSTVSFPSDIVNGAATYLDFPDLEDASGSVYQKGLIFGGRGSSVTNKTYKVEGSSYTLLNPSTSPAAREHHKIVYMRCGGGVILFGGVDSAGNALGDTWFYGLPLNTDEDLDPNHQFFDIGLNSVVTGVGSISVRWKGVFGHSFYFEFNTADYTVDTLTFSERIENFGFGNIPSTNLWWAVVNVDTKEPSVSSLIEIKFRRVFDTEFRVLNPVHGKVRKDITGELDSSFSESIEGGSDSKSYSAVAESGYSFSHWSILEDGASIADSIDNPIQFTNVNADYVATANFDVVLPPQYTLTVNTAGSGSGTVTSDPGDIDISYDGVTASGITTDEFVEDTTVTLTAAVAPGSDNVFTGWTGSCTGLEESITLSMDEARTVTATFRKKFTITLNMPTSPAWDSVGAPAPYTQIFEYYDQALDQFQGAMTKTFSVVDGEDLIIKYWDEYFDGWEYSLIEQTSGTTNFDVLQDRREDPVETSPGSGLFYREIHIYNITSDVSYTVHFTGVKELRGINTSASTRNYSLTFVHTGKYGSVNRYSIWRGHLILSHLATADSDSTDQVYIQFANDINDGGDSMGQSFRVYYDNNGTWEAHPWTDITDSTVRTSDQVSLAGTDITYDDSADYLWSINVTLNYQNGYQDSVDYAFAAITDLHRGIRYRKPDDYDPTNDWKRTGFLQFPIIRVTADQGLGTITWPGGSNFTESVNEILPSGEASTVFTVVPATCYAFNNWSGEISEATINNNEIQFGEVDQNTATTANFTIIQYLLTANGAGDGRGSIISSPVGINGSYNGSATEGDNSELYDCGSVVTLTAIAVPGSEFSNWSGPGTGGATINGNQITVTMSEAKSVTANFTREEYTLIINYAGSGSGSVNVSTSPPYHLNDVVTLTPVPNSGSTFTGWSNYDTGTDTLNGQDLTVTIYGDRTITATFEQAVTVTVNLTDKVPNPGTYLKFRNPETDQYDLTQFVLDIPIGGNLTIGYTDTLTETHRSNGFTLASGTLDTLAFDRDARTVTLSNVQTDVVVTAELFGITSITAPSEQGNGLEQVIEYEYLITGDLYDFNYFYLTLTDEETATNKINKVYIKFMHGNDKLFFRDDDNTSWSTYILPVVEGTLQNSQALVDASQCTVENESGDGANYKLTIPIVFKTWNETEIRGFGSAHTRINDAYLVNQSKQYFTLTPGFSAVTVNYELTSFVDLRNVSLAQQQTMVNDINQYGVWEVKQEGSSLNLYKPGSGSDWQIVGSQAMGSGTYYLPKSTTAYDFEQIRHESTFNRWWWVNGQEIESAIINDDSETITFKAMPVGHVIVKLEPNLWRDDGAMWRQMRDNPSLPVDEWRLSGFTDHVEFIGKYPIQLSPVSGWNNTIISLDPDQGPSPAGWSVSEQRVVWNTTTTITISREGQHGTVEINFVDNDYLNAYPWEMQWYPRPTGVKLFGRQSNYDVPVGYQYIDFYIRITLGANKPSSFIAEVRPQQAWQNNPNTQGGVIYRNYIHGRVQGSAARDAGGKWRWRATQPVGNHSPWYGHEVRKSMDGIARFNVSFLDIPGFSKPAILTFENTANNRVHFVSNHMYTPLSSREGQVLAVSTDGTVLTSSSTTETEAEDTGQFATYTRLLLSRNVPLDFDHDGVQDVGFYRPSDQTWYIRGMGKVQFGSEYAIPAPGDYDGDGKTEIVYFDSDTCYWHVYQGKSYKFGQPGDIPIPGDYDGDGTTDPAVYRRSQAKVIARLSSVKQIVSRSSVAGFPFVGDFDGDGDDELIHLNVDGEGNHTWMLNGQRVLDINLPDGITPALADYTGDGRTEKVYFEVETAIWRTVNGDRSIAFGEPGDVPVPGDYNNDGKAELAVFRPGTGQWFIRGISGAVYTGKPGDIPLCSGN